MLGYKNVFCFQGGIPEWRAFNYPLTVNDEYAAIKVKKISPQKLNALLKKDPSIYVLDVRPIDCEGENIFIKNVHICPMVYLSYWHSNIPKDRKIVVTDKINKKAILAAKFLKNKGFNVIGALKGGIARWRAENLPVEYITEPLKHISDNPCRD